MFHTLTLLLFREKNSVRNELTLFQLFFDDNLFDFIKNMTNKNALVKRRANPEKHKTKWNEIENINEMKTFFWNLCNYGHLKTR